MMRRDPIKTSIETSPDVVCADKARRAVSVAVYHLHCSRMECSPNTKYHASADGSRRVAEAGCCPMARYGHSLTEIRPNVLFLFGGVSKDKECLNDAWILHLCDSRVVAVQLELAGDVPSCRFGHTAHCTLDGKSLIIFGGSNNTEYYNDIYAVSVMELGSMQSAMFRRLDVSPPSLLLLLPTPVSSDAHLTPPSLLPMYRAAAPPPSGFSAQLPSTAPWPGARRSHTLTSMDDGKAILFGGYAGTSFKDVWLLDEKLFEWKYVEAFGLNPHNPLAGTPESRYCHSAVVYPCPAFSTTAASPRNKEDALHRCLYVFGGFPFSATGDNVLWELNLTTFVWQPVTVGGVVTPPARFGHTACVLSHCMVVFGGTDKFLSGCALEDCFIFKFRSREWHPFNSDWSLASHHTSVSGSTDTVSEEGVVLQLQRVLAAKLPAVFRWGLQRRRHSEERFHGCIPPGRRLHAAAKSSRNAIVIFGGWDGTSVDGDFFQLVLTLPTLRESSYDFLCSACRFGC